MTASTLNGQSIGTVNSEQFTKDAQLFQQAMPGSDSNSLISLDLFGASRTIDVKGRYTASNGNIQTFIVWLDSLVNGNQSVIPYYSEKSTVTYNVLVNTVNWSGDEAGVNYVDYELNLLEAAQ